MSGTDRPEEPAPPAPDPAALEALDADDWAQVLPVLRAAMNDLDADVASSVVRRLRAAPAGRLASGRSRRELCRLVAGDPRLREAVSIRLEAADLPDELRRRLGGVSEPSAVTAADETRTAAELRRARQAATDAAGRAERDRARLRDAREQRDRAIRRAEGAETRAAAAEREAEGLGRRIVELESLLEEERARLARSEEDRRRAVERERRRAEREVADLRDEVRSLRRQAEARRDEPARPRVARAEVRSREAPEGRAAPAAAVPGRPTRLPEAVARGTAEEVDHLLGRGRLVLVDGYNVTLGHRSGGDLPQQRAWLVRRLANLASQRGVRPVVVFDGERGSGSRPPAGAREVQVRFTPEGVTADDELLFIVEALPPDEPVLAVTDDRELAERLVARGVDVVGTGPFLWAIPH